MQGYGLLSVARSVEIADEAACSFARAIEKVCVETDTIAQFQTESGWVRVDSLWDKQRETHKRHIEVTKNLKFGVSRAIIEQGTAFRKLENF